MGRLLVWCSFRVLYHVVVFCMGFVLSGCCFLACFSAFYGTFCFSLFGWYVLRLFLHTLACACIWFLVVWGPFFSRVFLRCALPRVCFACCASRLYAAWLMRSPGMVSSALGFCKRRLWPNIGHVCSCCGLCPLLISDFVLFFPSCRRFTPMTSRILIVSWLWTLPNILEYELMPHFKVLHLKSPKLLLEYREGSKAWDELSGIRWAPALWAHLTQQVISSDSFLICSQALGYKFKTKFLETSIS